MELLELPKGKKIILFDGDCNLCDAAVQYIIKYDKSDVFRFVSLQSELGQRILKHIGIQSDKMDSIVLYEPGIAYYYKSSAALEIAKNLQGIFTLATLFRLLPSGIRDLMYDYVAKNRYKWYGKKETCSVLTENSRFL
jgi:predicted DCC family thiol-disulfide oxidoreductase YuxK